MSMQSFSRDQELIAKVDKRPEPHQQKALDSIADEMLTADRALVVMACGTGKTLVELWATEALQPKRVLVLVPSLGLMQQVLDEWRQNADPARGAHFLCVCSDHLIGAENDELQPEFPTCTDSKLVNDFLDWCEEGQGTRSAVIFSTYHSAPVVGEALQMRSVDDRSLDVAIFEEAHRTVGGDGKQFSFALSDERMQIRKRLYFTATPRVVVGTKIDGERVIATMDDVAVYGRRVFDLGIAEAVRSGIVVPYKVIISVIAENAPRDENLLPLITTGELVNSEPLAVGAVALRRAMAQFGLKKAISFHNTVSAAKKFAASVGEHLPDFECLHVSGRQTPGDRFAAMTRFREAAKSVVTNARCLTEGIDVPSVDMVAFMDPRKSRVDVVQALGRAMRKSGAEKDACYVFLPLHLDLRLGESLEEALDRSAFGGIAGLLASLVENDTDLMDLFRAACWGQGSLRNGKTHAQVHIDEAVPLDGQFVAKLLSVIETRLIQEVSGLWNRRMGELISFKQTHGHCNVPQRVGKLGHWVSHQRISGKRGELSADKKRQLEAVGLVFEDPRIVAWEGRFQELVEFQKFHGHCNVPVDHGRLGTWVKMQRERSKLQGYPADRRERLAGLGFEFSPFSERGVKIRDGSRARHEATWDLRLKELEEFKREHGHCDVPQLDGSKLGWWVSRQRVLSKRANYPAERRDALEKLGFVFEKGATTPPSLRLTTNPCFSPD